MDPIQSFVILVLLATTYCVELNWVEGIERHVEHSPFHQVAFMSDSEEALRVPGVTDLFRRIAAKRLILHTNPQNFIKVKTRMMESASTLLIYLHTQLLTSIVPSNKSIDLMKTISYGKRPLEFLIITHSSRKNTNLMGTFCHAWSTRMLNLTILELIGTENQTIGSSELEILIHRYNPFLDHLDTKNYSLLDELFPDLLRTMHGYALQIGVSDDPPFARKEADGEGAMRGPNIDFIETVAKIMNFTINYRTRPRILSSSDAFESFKMDIVQGNLDIQAQLFSLLGEYGVIDSLRTEVIYEDTFCAAVPLIEKGHSLFSVALISGYLPAVLIIILFSILKYLKILDSHHWSPFLVIGSLFGISMNSHPNHPVDRIMFAVLILISVVYSTQLYSAMTDNIVNEGDQTKWANLEQLSDSNLPILISVIHRNRTFTDPDPILLKLKKRTSDSDKTFMEDLIYLSESKNISRLGMKSIYYLVQHSHPKSKMKLLKPCLWYDRTAFILAQNSPYHHRIGKLITRFREAGIMDKLYHRELKKLEEATLRLQAKEAEVEAKISNQSIILLIVGYISATIIFLIELIVHFKFSRE